VMSSTISTLVPSYFNCEPRRGPAKKRGRRSQTRCVPSLHRQVRPVRVPRAATVASAVKSARTAPVGGRRHRGRARGTVERNGDHGAIAQAHRRCDVRRVRSACACFSDSQAPARTPIDFVLFPRRRRRPVASASSPLSVAATGGRMGDRIGDARKNHFGGCRGMLNTLSYAFRSCSV